MRYGCWFLVGLLAGCGSTPSSAPDYDPATQARIRVFHVGSVYLILGDICQDQSPEWVHASAGGFSYLVPNRTLGMPRTDDMPTFSFHEFAIPAGKTVTIRHFWQVQTASGGWLSCGPTHLSFRPEAGVDYDTFMRFNQGACVGGALRQFRPTDDGKTTVQRLPVIPFSRCR